jgi:putative PIN family toxin of toxin-antitoxin system
MPKADLRYVFDTNTLVSAVLIKDSVPGRALAFALERGSLLASPDTLAELAEVLSRDKLDRYVSQEEREEFFATFVARVEVVEPLTAIRACRDPKDDKFLELAVEGGATAIVSGDDDLLALHPFRGIQLVSPASFASGRAPTKGDPQGE